MHFSTSNNLQQLAKILIIDYNVEINGKNRFGNSPIHIAARMGNHEIIQLILKHPKCDINILTTGSINALTIAVAHNNLSTAYLLLGQRLKCKVQDSALIYAAMNENGEELIRLLLNHGANVNGTDSKGNTALMHAVAKSHEKNVNVLISREWKPSIEINKQNCDGWTALHFAYSVEKNSAKRFDIIRILLNKNANINLKNNKGIKPKDINNDIDDENEFEDPSPNKRRRID